MIIIGCDYHPGFQQIAWLDSDDGELQERRLAHREEAEQFYGKLKQPGKPVRVGMEASGHARWFERTLESNISGCTTCGTRIQAVSVQQECPTSSWPK